MPNIKNKKRFGRTSSQRKALMNSLVSALINKGKIEITEAKAKELRPVVEKMITLALDGSVHHRRILEKRLSPSLAKKMIEETGPRYKDRKGGYTRILKLGPRNTDSARMAIIELI